MAREFRANVYSVFRHPIGALQGLIMWLSPKRLWWRLTKKGFQI